MKERLPKKLYTNRDTFADANHFTPYRTDDEDLADRRRQYHDTVADMQYRGLTSLTRLREEVFDSRTSTEYVDSLLERVGFGTANHGLIEESPAMYSVFDLAQIAGGDSIDRWHKSPEDLRKEQLKHLSLSAELAYYFREATRNNDPDRAFRLARGLGRRSGNAAALTTGIVFASAGHRGNPIDIQHAVRDGSIEAIREVNAYATEIGVLPSAAQLVEPDSPLAVDIRRSAPVDVRRTFARIVANLPEETAA